MSCRVVVLISGNGSNLQALLDDAAKQHRDNGNYEIVAVFSNRPKAYGLERAASAKVEAHCIDHTGFSERLDFDMALQQEIDQFKPDLIVLAGFMRILTPEFVRHYTGRLINIHPSLLPKYPGLNTHQRAIDAGDTETGATVHFVTEELDGGPAIVQASVGIVDGDSAESLTQRIHLEEHRIYPLAVRLFASGQLKLQGNKALFNEEPLPATGVTIKQ